MAQFAAKWSTALNRFGLGARGMEAPMTGDPREAIAAELAAPGAGTIQAVDLPSSAAALVALYDFAAKQAGAKAKADAMRAANDAAPATPSAMTPAPAQDAKMDAKAPGVGGAQPKNPIAEAFAAEAGARLDAACAAPVGYVERLVAFWSNHFCISAAKGQNVRMVAGAFEREAIRPFVLGRFADMLRAVEQHPAMLHFLDNAQSVGPDSPAGRNSKRGLNENLAREILELHTLGVDGGYSQSDVTEFARVLTGWTVVGREGRLGNPGAFAFNANAHEAGSRQIVGRHYDREGVAQGEAVLDDLARSPATARHIATKFVRAFVADAPPAPLVARLAEEFRKSDGDLGALARTLVGAEGAWSAPPTKLRDPWQMVAAAYRALGLDRHERQRITYHLALLGMPLWTPGGPNGYADTTAVWLSPEGLKTRVEVATALGRLAKDAPPPPDLIDRVIPDASQETRQSVLRAESRPQAYALLIMSPEFQRR